jgi:hypothetical protein
MAILCIDECKYRLTSLSDRMLLLQCKYRRNTDASIVASYTAVLVLCTYLYRVT